MQYAYDKLSALLCSAMLLAGIGKLETAKSCRFTYLRQRSASAYLRIDSKYLMSQESI